MRQWFVLLLTLVFLVTTSTAVLSESNPVAESVLVDIWPEYDRPAVLVIYHIILSPDTKLPAEVSLRIPRAAGEPFNIAMQENGALYTLQFDTQVQGEWLDIRFTTPSPEMQVEYYDPRLDRSQPMRNFEYRWPGDFTVHSMSVQIQQPINSKNMAIKPDMGPGTVGPDSLTYYHYGLGKVDEGIGFKIEFNYEKSDDTLTSSSGGSVQASKPVNQSTPGRTSFSTILSLILGALGIVLLSGGAYWYWHSGNIRVNPENRRHAGGRSPQSAESSQEIVYCHQCGKRAWPGDLYCRTCGSQLRLE
jgi:hypothetical protein